MAHEVRNYDDFINILLDAGFTMGGGNNEGIFAIVNRGWDQEPLPDSPIRWHTGDPETDPWEWINRVLDDRTDIIYGKLFFKKSGYITTEWMPYFLAARRGGMSFDETYEMGTISHFAKRIYEVVVSHSDIPVEEIKRLGGFMRDDKSGFDRAMVELQMKMFILPCGRRFKISNAGEQYGWSSTVFCTAEKRIGEDAFNHATDIDSVGAIDKISQQVLKLNPLAEEKKIKKFILG